MIKNYFITTIRNLWRNKIFSFINIIGLALGLATCIIIYLFVENELSFDNYHNNPEQIYRVAHTINFSSGTDVTAVTQYPFADMVKNNLTGYELVVRAIQTEQNLKIKNENFYVGNCIFTDSTFFELFKYDWIAGTKKNTLAEINTAIVTQSIEESYFGGNAIGKTFKITDSITVKITGVVSDSPHNTHLPIDVLVSAATFTERFAGFNFNNWQTTSGGFFTYIKLLPDTDKSFFEKLIDKEKRKYLNEKWAEKEFFHLQPLRNIHINGEYANSNTTYTTPIKYLYVFSIIGVFILILACINFINLSTAQAIKRSKEVGVRKVIGATKMKLFIQFILETSLITLFSVIAATIITEMFISNVNELYNNNIRLSVYNSAGVFYFIGIIFSIVTIAAGAYPSLVLSSFSPIKSLKNKVSSHKKQSFLFRNILVIVQFTVSISLIIGTIVVSSQLKYMMNKDMGYETQNIVSVQMPNNYEAFERKRFKQLLLSHPEIVKVSYCFSLPNDNSRYGSFMKFDKTTDEKHLSYNLPADEDYPELFKLKLLAGKWFDKNDAEDTITKAVVNEVAVKMMGITNPNDAIGKMIGKETKVIGVTKNFHNMSLHDAISPVLLFYDEQNFYDVAIKIANNNKKETMDIIRKSWDEVFMGEVFSSRFFEDVITEQYQNEKRTVNVIQVFALLAILIACLGVFGVISFFVINKTKEIGVRKVFGAKAINILILISKGYLALIIISAILAIPVSWYFLTNWLENFTYKIEISIWPFLYALTTIAAVTLIVMSFYLLKAIRMNPVKSLKYE